MRTVLGAGGEHRCEHILIILIILMRDDARDNVSRLHERQTVALPFNMHGCIFNDSRKKNGSWPWVWGCVGVWGCVDVCVCVWINLSR